MGRSIAPMTFADLARARAAEVWEQSITPALYDYIAIPNVSEAYDADWKAHGYMDQAVMLITEWCRARPILGLTVEVVQLEGLSPLILMEIPPAGGASAEDTVLLYGHLDKQPEMSGWREGLGPWTPVREGDRLYGRGGADDGYAAFASLTAIEAVHAAQGAHTRCIVMIEASEESGSPDLPAYVDHLLDRIGTPSLVVCLDSGCANYDRMWVTTSLRGLVGFTLRVDVLEEGVHSGDASGIVPSSFRIMRELLDRIEDAETGQILVPEMHVEIPADRVAQAAHTASALGYPASNDFRFSGRTEPMVADAAEQLLNRTWRPTLSYIGASGFPPPDRQGNVLRPSTALALSFRLPPTCNAQAALEAVTKILLADPPSKATVTIEGRESASGWNAPEFAPWLLSSLDAASIETFGLPTLTEGEGGSIPFMGMLGDKFPDAQFVITGVLGPESNAHGPNEYLHLPTAQRLTAALAIVLNDHAKR
jgi:acetylornithine deacetylase/succinyl-diaminopimelate desuccinylase-like protein